ncbi:MAG: hypothetical protein JNL58_01655 [Planctomyces sp.]|nr:hypothetical protein [Planctomyces sp.]
MQRRQFVHRTLLSLPVIGLTMPDARTDEGDHRTADSVQDPSEDEPPTEAAPAWGTPTLGGMQFWGDLHFEGGWKIQRNVLTGHCRLLDPRNYRFASGSLEECQRNLRAINAAGRIPADPQHMVILCHGIGRSSKSFSTMAGAMRQQGYGVVPFEYPSTRVPLESSCLYLDSLIKSLSNAKRIDFVVHSMGGLLVRMMLRECGSDPRFERMIMLGTPNQGAEMADMLKTNYAYRLIYGPAGQQLVSDSEGLISKLPAPSFSFGIVAGGKGDNQGFNPLLPGDDDGTVTVESCRLAGAADFMVVNRIHSFLMRDPAVIAATLRFLRNARFAEDPND